eukprot:UN24148
MVILHPIVRLKADTPYFIMPTPSGSKSGKKFSMDRFLSIF